MKMNGLSWSALAIILVVCHVTIAAPSLRFKRQDELTLDPVNSVDSGKQEVDREKRKLDEASFQSKNAVLGFVFGKLDQFIDAKTRFIDQLDKGNIEKNKQLGISAPQPIPNFQALISGVIGPKISAITQKLGGLSSGGLSSVLGGSSGSSSSGSSGSGSQAESASDDSSSGGSAAGAGGLSSILSSVLRLSGPLLSSSLGGGASATSSDSTTEADDDF